MSIKIKIGGDENSGENTITMSLNARKSIDGHVMIFDHKDIDIIIIPEEKTIVSFPKEDMHDDVYATQDRLFDFLSKKGVINKDSIQSGNVYASLQAEYPESESANALQVVLFSIAKWIEKEKPGMEMEEYYEKSLLDYFTNPSDEESTELGEVPHEEEKGFRGVDSYRGYLRGYIT